MKWANSKMPMKLLLTLLLLAGLAQAQTKTVVTLQQFRKSNLTSDLSAWVNGQLVLHTSTIGTTGWFYYSEPIRLLKLQQAEIIIVVAQGSKDAGLEIGNRLDPNAKNGLFEAPTTIRFLNTFGDLSGNLFFMQRKNTGEPYIGEYLKPFPTGAHSLKMTVTKDSLSLDLLTNGIWQRLKSLQNPLPDSFYVAVSASWKWVLASGEIVLTPKPIKPPVSKIIYGDKIVMHWNKGSEPKMSYLAHLGLASRSYPMSWATEDTFFAFTKLDTGRTYFASVTAKDSAGNESAYSDEVSFIRRDTTKADPLDLTGDKKVSLADYTLLKKNLGLTGKGDFDDSGVIDELDLLWYWRFGRFDVE